MAELYGKNWHKKALELKLQGISNRQIARMLWGASDGESRLRKFFKRQDVANIIDSVPIVEDKPVKILFWDIETLPHVSFHWDWWGVNVSPMIHNIHLGFMLSHAWQWGVDGEVHSSILTPAEIQAKDDSRLVLEMHMLFDHADVIIAHNGKKFDVKKANASFAKMGLKPPSPYKVVDTVRISKKFFNLPSHSLAFLCEYFELGVQKVKHDGFELWERCYRCDPESLKLMEEYNRGDIPTLVKLYLHLRTWGNDGVDIAPIIDSDKLTCPTCGSHDVIDSHAEVLVGRKLHKVYRCHECDAQSKLNVTRQKVYLTKI